MKITACLIVICLIAQPTLATERPVAWWSFDQGDGNTLHDHSGHEHHGAIHGATWIDGVRGKALQFDGEDDYVQVKLERDVNIAGQMSLVCFIRTASDNARDRLIYGDGHSMAVERNISIGLDRGLLFVGHGDGATYQVKSPSVRFDDRWHHLAIVYEAQRQYIYIDGELVESTALAVPLTATTSADRFIGGWWAGHFKGAIDEMQLYDRALSESEILTHYRGEPVDAQPAASLLPRIVLSKQRLDVMVLLRNTVRWPAKVALVDAEGAVVMDRPLWPTINPQASQRGEASVSCDTSDLPPGRFAIQCGALASTEIELPASPAWFGSTAGIADVPPAPFMPVARDGNTVHVIGRTIELAEGGLIEQIATGDEPMLAAPIALVGEGSSPVQCETQVDYDGLITVRVRVADGTVARLAIEVPLQLGDEPYLYAWDQSATFGGACPDEHAMAFTPIVWLGDNDRGLSFLCESNQWWQPADAKRAIEIERHGDVTVLRINLIGKPTHIAADRQRVYTFMLHPTPVKPITRDGWDLAITPCPWYGFDYDMLTRDIDGKPAFDWLAEQGNRSFLATNWTDVMTYPWPIGKERLFEQLIDACHDAGMRCIPYHGYQINETAPEYAFVSDEVLRLPEMANPDIYPGMDEPQMVATVCMNSIWQDALVDGFARMIDTYGIDGIYLDSTNMPWACQNELHGCGYRDADGKIHATYPIMAVRETFKRLYTIAKQDGRDLIVDSHVYDCMNSAALSFCDIYWTGEQLSPHTDHEAQGLPLERFRAEMMGYNWGVPADLLYYRLGDYDAALGISLLHDITTRTNTEDQKRTMGAVFQLMADFGRKQAEFLPYWREQDVFAVTGDGCKASAYRRVGGDVLALVVNLASQPANVRVKLNQPCDTAVDGVTRQPLAVDGGSVDFALEPMAWRYVWFAAQ
jgi:hypothetical protein